MAVFRAYDIRGIYPAELDEALAERIGKAFGTLLIERSGKAGVAVGGDVRLSTPQLKKSLIRGLLSTGADVIDVGMVPSPMLYFAVASLGLDGGAEVTASHNPGNYNGVKLAGKGGECLSWDTGISRVKDLTENGGFVRGSGSLEERSIEDAYVKHITGLSRAPRKLKVVVDAANGACSLVAPRLFQRLGWDVIPLFCEPDGRFPNHEADPIKKKNLAHLQEKVRETGADLGISFDGDGDRIGIVDEKGEVAENNKVFSLIIKDTLEKKPGSPVVYEVVVSKMVEDTIKRFGGRPVLSKVGHSYIQAALNSEKAALAGENSGHYYFPENFGYDDALFAGIKVAELLSKGPLSVRTEEIPSYLTSEEFRPHCPDDRKFQAVRELQGNLKAGGHEVNEIDGARAVLEGGWFIVRASNTGPQLVVRWEAEDKDGFERIGSLVREQLETVGVSLDE